MTLIEFINLFIKLIVIGSLSVSGWFFSTRGQIEILPNGKKIKTGKIFKAWYFFWTKKKLYQSRAYYAPEQLKKLLIELRANFQKYNFIQEKQTMFKIESVNDKENGVPYFDLVKFIDTVCDKWEVCLDGDNNKGFGVYKNYDEYVFPELVRMPLAQCATCFASVYGSIFYFGVIILSGIDLFTWSTWPVPAMLFFWIVFCLALAVVNTAVAKKFN